ncbi:MAG: N-6 DNA methylase [Kiritimatiellae bacterium]|nr:N-6 DNA methylase [Kiritimatiellia bacterium]
MSLVEDYTNTVGYEHRKRFAQFFTPAPIARFMVKWALEGSSRAAIHDPAFGLGAFFASAPLNCEFTGADIDEAVLLFFETHAERKPAHLSRTDYLLDFGTRHDNIVCNPPYLRFQKFLNREAVFQAFRERFGVSLSGYTNIASAFLVKSVSELKRGGRLAYILPSEFLNAGYGTAVKECLVRDGHLDSVIEVECEHEAFGEVITSVCIVLYDSGMQNDTVSFRKITSMVELSDVMERPPVNTISLNNLDVREKWGKYFVPDNNRVFPALHLLRHLSEYGRFSRGIATGANDFFVLSKSDISERRIPNLDCRPCITKSQQLNGLIFTDKDFLKLSESNAPVYLFSPGDIPDEDALRYIRYGEERGYQNGFITRHRKPWFKTEARGVAPILLNVFSRSGYKVVRNYSTALSLTNFHCFYPNLLYAKYVDWIFLYLHSNIGRKILSLSKRKYGNLLDKFEPNDLNFALVPSREFFDSLGMNLLSTIMRAVNRSENVDNQLDSIFRPLLSCGDEKFEENGKFLSSCSVSEGQQLSLSITTGNERCDVKKTRGVTGNCERSVSREEVERTPVQMTFFNPSVFVVKKSPLTLFASYRRDCKAWIVKSGLYNYPITKRQFESDGRFAQAQQLILQNRRSKLMFFAVKGCEFVTRKQLESMGYPRKGTHAHYLLFRIEPVDDFEVPFQEDDFSVLIGKGCSYDEFVRTFRPRSGKVKAVATRKPKKKGVTGNENLEKRH